MNGALKIDQLHKIYNSGKEKIVALDHVSVEFTKNSICGLLGSNGAGKTTLIKCAIGLLEPTSGKILIDGSDIVNDSKLRLKHISVVLDGGRNLMAYMTVQENMRYFSWLRGKTYRKDSEYIRDVLDCLGIDSIYNKRVQTLSFGMRQRASVAVALACRSDIIFMDEPTTGLDIDYQAELGRLLLKLKEKYGCTIIVSSHDMRFVENVCNDCVLIDKGRLIKSGKIEEFKNSFSSVHYIISCGSELSDKQLDVLRGKIKIHDYDREKHTLGVIWQKTDDFCDLTALLSANGIAVHGVETVGGLEAAINSMRNSNNSNGGAV